MNKIEYAIKSDFRKINNLLLENQLPAIDENYPHALYLKTTSLDDQIIGAIGIERYERYGLLRSLVVDQKYRNQSIASRLLDQLLEKAVDLKLESLYLLTTTADHYFDKKKFLRIDRSEVPEAVKQSSEFKDVCPLSSVVMMKKIEKSQ
ncbi:MAG TPA: arsenic resistance N-acetyltransferase ArsN2 [Prolixibacteraceae bacterium]|nr:arsenic resistance N-acetyltransferase ArsN2 [Prolixibacteraceae bacterium]